MLCYRTVRQVFSQKRRPSPYLPRAAAKARFAFPKNCSGREDPRLPPNLAGLGLASSRQTNEIPICTTWKNYHIKILLPSSTNFKAM